MKFPKSYSQITVSQYQEIYSILKGKVEFDEWVKILSILSGKSVDEIEALPIKTLKRYLSKLTFLTEFPKNKAKRLIFLKGKLYKLETNAENLSTAQYVSIKTFCQEGKQVENLDKICSVSFKRLTWRGWRQDVKTFNEDCERFKEAKMSSVYGVVFFCSKVLIFLMVNTQDYLEAIKVIKEREKEIMSIIQDETFWTSGAGMQ